MESAIVITLDEKNNELSRVNVQFNPADYKTTHSAKYADNNTAVKTNSAPPQFTSEENSSMSVKLTLDGCHKAGVTDPEQAQDILGDAEFFRKLTEVDESLHRPPVCAFFWGSFSFEGVAQQVSIDYTMFASTGMPIRAVVQLTIQNTAKKSAVRLSPDRTRRMAVIQDTPLYMTAYEAYNDPSQWRRIAVANGIRNPLRLKPGMVLRVPPVEDDGL